jgi:hypothetical protein
MWFYRLVDMKGTRGPFESSLLEKNDVTGARNITTIVESLFSNSRLFQADGYCIDTLWGDVLIY